jgi:hypothetical protein
MSNVGVFLGISIFIIIMIIVIFLSTRSSTVYTSTGTPVYTSGTTILGTPVIGTPIISTPLIGTSFYSHPSFSKTTVKVKAPTTKIKRK